MSFACQDQREATQRKLVELVCNLSEVGGNLAGAAHWAERAAHRVGVVHWEKLSSVILNGCGALGRCGALIFLAKKIPERPPNAQNVQIFLEFK